MKLTTKKRNSLPDSDFVFPATHAYPVEDRKHAADAKSRASGAYNKGNLSASGKAKVDAKANRVLGKGRGR